MGPSQSRNVFVWFPESPHSALEPSPGGIESDRERWSSRRELHQEQSRALGLRELLHETRRHIPAFSALRSSPIASTE